MCMGVGRDSHGQPWGYRSLSPGTPTTTWAVSSTSEIIPTWSLAVLAYQLVEGDMRSLGIIKEPPGGGSHRGQAHVHCQEDRRKLALVASCGFLATISPS